MWDADCWIPGPGNQTLPVYFTASRPGVETGERQCEERKWKYGGEQTNYNSGICCRMMMNVMPGNEMVGGVRTFIKYIIYINSALAKLNIDICKN